MRLHWIILLVAVGGCIGCAATSAPPSPGEVQEIRRTRANLERAVRLVESGAIYSGQSIQDALKVCTPHRIDFVDGRTFIHFGPVPDVEGLYVLAIDDKLVWARWWSCNGSRDYFSSISAEEKQAAMEALSRRVFGPSD